MLYTFALTYADLELLKRCRETQARVLFKKILSHTSVDITSSPHHEMMPF